MAHTGHSADQNWGDESRAELPALLLDTLRTAIAVITPDRSVLFVNQSWRNQPIAGPDCPLQVAAGDRLLHADSDIRVHRQQLSPRLLDAVEAILSGNRQRVTLQPRPGAPPPHYRWRIRPFMLSGRRHALLARRDVTREINRSRRMRATLNLFRTMFEAASDGILLVSRCGVIREANPAACHQFGYPRTDLIGTAVETLLPQSLRERHVRYREAFMKEGRARTMAAQGGRELLAQRQDGSEFAVEVGLSPLRGLKDIRTLAIVRDVSERRELLRQQLDQEKIDILRRLGGGIAHDFNNLFTSILGTAELALEDSAAASGHLREMLLDIHSATETAIDLTTTLQTFARADAGDSEVVDIADTLAGDARILKALAGSRVRVQTRIAAESMPARIDPMRFTQVLMNLVVNASQAMGGDGMITLSAEVVDLPPDAAPSPDPSPSRWIAISIRDTGPGLDASTLSRVFDPYFTTKADGSGLGLASARDIITATGGWIHCDGTQEQGAEFIIFLPRA